ncbi:MAG TPA: hypothetical protein VL981_02915 [Candidatus Methylacidiphilales bacterium]|nr:hypothetical protein [Candidatus Methylacidiphilales bacterium]
MPPEIIACLAPDEKVVWSGQPRPYVFILRGLPNLAYGVTWGVLGAFWYHAAGGIGKYSAFTGWWKLTPLFSVPFIAVGLSFFFYPIRLGALARRTWYVVTDRRFFIAQIGCLLRGNDPPRLRVFSTEEIAPPVVQKRSGGLEDVILTKRALANPHLVPRLDAGFFGIEKGEEAVRAIQALAKRLSEK